MYSWRHMGISRIGDVPIIDSFASGIKMCESLVDLNENSGVYMTRRGYYNAKPPAEAVARLRELYGLEPVPDPKNDHGLPVRGGQKVIYIGDDLKSRNIKKIKYVRGESYMHIVVCLKQVIDPEIPPRYFKIDPETNRPEEGSGDMVMDSYAENALEAAIQLRDKIDGATVTALCLGDEESEDVLRRALAFTADQAVRVWDDEWENLDGQAVGYILAQTIKNLGDVDLV